MAKDERAGNISPLLPPWTVFLADLAETVRSYNARGHSSHPGKRTPDAVYDARLDPNSVWQHVGDAELHAMWLPEVKRTPKRGLFELFRNTYSMPELVHVLAENEPVRVRFDIHRAEQVWVLDMDGCEIGTAQWNGHRSAAFPVAFMDAERAKRVERKGKSLDDKRAASELELMQTVEAPWADTPVATVREPVPMPASMSVPMPASVAPRAAPAPAARPRMSFGESLAVVAALEAAKRAADEAAAPATPVAETTLPPAAPPPLPAAPVTRLAARQTTLAEFLAQIEANKVAGG